MIELISIDSSAMDGGIIEQMLGKIIAANGRLPAKLGRASARPNLAEWSERYASETKPEEHHNIRISIHSATSAGRLLGAGSSPILNLLIMSAGRPEGEARIP